MPASRTPNRKANIQKPRRTHNLGGCATCRRRHVKCDQVRPKCSVCRNSNLECGGWPDQIRWASLTTGPIRRKSKYDVQPDSTRRGIAGPSNEPTVQTSPNNPPVSNVQFPSPHEEPTAIGIQTGDGSLPTGVHFPSVDDTEIRNAHNPNATSALAVEQPLDWGWLFDGTGGLGWNDLFDNTVPLYTNDMPSLTEEDFGFHSSSLAQDQQWGPPIPLFNHAANSVQEYAGQLNIIDNPIVPEAILTEGAQIIETTDKSLMLEHAKILLKHFREVVIPKFSPVPMPCKSPWEIMNWRAAIQTHADMTYLQADCVTFASKANLFAVLACSAYSIINGEPSARPLSTQTAAQIMDYAYGRAKKDMQDSLKLEISGAHKAKYKDQLMALISLIAITVCMILPRQSKN